ncbi:hypothetical protein WA158_005901 [Blastocystis sp. Blastoise]
MSQETHLYVHKKRKCDNLGLLSARSDEISHINLIFQDERKISIPLSFLKNYQNSMLYKAYTSSESYLEDEGAYYIDSPFLSIDKLVDVMCNSVPLDSFSFQELIDLNETLTHFLGYESIDYQMKITDFLVQLFLTFIEENNYVFTEERNKLFLQHSYLFDYFNVIDVTLQYDFDDRIPYEYIYPSNLHDLFPKIKRYVIDGIFSYIHKFITYLACYYPLKNYIQIKSTDIHYIPLYKEYKRQYYEKDNESIEKEEKENFHDEIIDIDIDEEIRNEKEEEKPDIYIESLSDYSREYNEEMIKKEKNDSPIDDKIIYSLYYFIFVDDNEIIDRHHPILYDRDFESNDILFYILNLPICMQLKNIKINFYKLKFLLQLEIPSLLLFLKDSLYSSLEIFNISQLCDLYNKEYDVVEFINKYFSFLCKGNYNTVTSLAINFHMDIEEELEETDDSEIYDTNKSNDYKHIEKKLEQLCESDIHTLNDIIYHFFSLFSDNIKEFKIDGHFVRNSIFLTEKYISLPFWSNIQHLSLDLIGDGKKKILNSLTHFFKNKKLRNLISLKFDYGHHFELSSFLEFIEGFTLNSSFSLPFLDTFKEPISYNVFNFFPSFLYFLHKPITYICMKDSIIKYEENENENDLNDQYIYNQLQQNYCKNIIDLNLCIDESSIISNIIDLIINNHFCYLRNLSLLFYDNDTYTKYSSLINNYKEKYNPNLNITYHNRQIDDYD